MAAPTNQEAGPSESPPPKEYTPDVIPTDPLTGTKDNEEDQAFDDTQTIREAPPPPDVRPILEHMLGADMQLSIHALSQRGDTQALINLYEANPSLDISERDEQDVTPLHWASINAQMSTCRWLLDHGAEVDAIGGDLKATPLQWAARNGHLYVIQLLLSRGADPNIADDQGYIVS
jgi:ankyrin repeat protein